jgi:hypothetical protein
MPFIPKFKQTSWTRHAEAKMGFYKLSKQRVLRVIHSPKRIEEGVAPKNRCHDAADLCAKRK